MNIGSGGSEAGQFQMSKTSPFPETVICSQLTQATDGCKPSTRRPANSWRDSAAKAMKTAASTNRRESQRTDGNIFIADYITGFIKKYSPNFDWQLTFGGYGTEKGQTKRAEYMDIRGSRIYLADGGNDRVIVFDLSGKFLFDFGKSGSGPGELNDPEAARFGSDGISM